MMVSALMSEDRASRMRTICNACTDIIPVTCKKKRISGEKQAHRLYRVATPTQMKRLTCFIPRMLSRLRHARQKSAAHINRRIEEKQSPQHAMFN